MRIERVRFNDVGPGFEILPVDVLNDGRLGNIQEIIVALEVLLPVLEALTAKGRLIQLPLLNHGPHRSIEDQDSALE